MQNQEKTNIISKSRDEKEKARIYSDNMNDSGERSSCRHSFVISQ